MTHNPLERLSNLKQSNTATPGGLGTSRAGRAPTPLFARVNSTVSVGEKNPSENPFLTRIR